MKSSMFGICLILCSSCLFTDSASTEPDEPTTIETTCDGNVVDFDVLAVSSGGYVTVESCPNLVVLKLFTSEGEKIHHVWDRGSKTVSLSESKNKTFVGLDDSVYRCAPECTLVKTFEGAEEVLVAVHEDETAYLVKYKNKIDFVHVKGEKTTKQKEERLGEFTNLQLMFSATDDGANFIATAHSGEVVYRFLEDGSNHSCISDTSDRGAFFGETTDTLVLLYKTQDGRLGLKFLTSTACVKETSDEMTGIDNFDIYNDSIGFATAVSVGQNVIITRFIGEEQEAESTVIIASGSRFEVAVDTTSFFLGALSDGALVYQQEIFPSREL